MSHLRKSASAPKNALSGLASEAPPDVVNDPTPLEGAQKLDKVRDELAAGRAVDALGGIAPKPFSNEISVSRASAMQNPHSVMRTNETVRGGHAVRGMMQKALAQLADSGFSENGQHEFIQQICRDAKTKWQPAAQRGESQVERLAPESMHDLAWMASTLRKVVPHTDVKLDKLNEFFGDHGFKLRTLDKTDGKQHFAQLDRGRFMDTLRAIRDGGGKAGGTDMKHLLGQLSHVYDVDDMKWAQSRLRTRVMAGQIKVPEQLEAKFNDFMAKRIDTNADVSEIALQARALRFAVKSGDSNAIAEQRDKFNAMVKSAAANKNDPDALFFASRVINRELGKCGNDPQARVLCSGFTNEIARRAGDKLDRYAMNQKIDGMLARGEITENQAYVMRVGVVTSVTNVELHQTLNFFQDSLKLELANAIAEMMDEVSETISRNMSDNIYDANGNIIETGAQRAEREAARRRIVTQASERVVLNDQQLRQTNIRLSEGDKQVRRTVAKVAANDSAGSASAYRSASGSLQAQAASAVDPGERSEFAGRAALADGAAQVLSSRRA